MHKLRKIEGIGKVYAERLHDLGIDDQDDLLREACSPSARRQLHDDSGISDKLILKWLNRADLARIKGVSEEYSDLLEHAGVDTVPELAMRNAANLYERVCEVNQRYSLVRRLPSEKQISDWIRQAKQLPRMINY